jgi:hypothetical protein
MIENGDNTIGLKIEINNALSTGKMSIERAFVLIDGNYLL